MERAGFGKEAVIIIDFELIRLGFGYDNVWIIFLVGFFRIYFFWSSVGGK